MSSIGELRLYKGCDLLIREMGIEGSLIAKPSGVGRNPATFDLAFLILQKSKVAMVFTLELKWSKILRGLVYFVLQF